MLKAGEVMKYFPESPKGDYGKKRTNICHTPDERLLELKENVQNEDGGINMCGAVDQMIAEGMECGLAQGTAVSYTHLTGAIFGPVLGGLIYRKTKNVYLVFVGEVFGTGVIGACASYPLMKMFYGLDAQSPFYYIPFYTPSAIVGAAMGVVVVLILKKTGVLNQMCIRDRCVFLLKRQ